MSRLLRDLATLMHAKINEQAEFDLDAMIGTAEDFMRRQLRGWFELPAILSAWRLRDADFVAPLRAKLQDMHFDDAQVQEVQECAEPTGLITRDPDSLPPWAKDYWTLSKLTVNHLLTDSGHFVDIPHSILDEKLTVELRRAWTTRRPKRAKMLRDWMENASSHVARNLPLEGRGH